MKATYLKAHQNDTKVIFFLNEQINVTIKPFFKRRNYLIHYPLLSYKKIILQWLIDKLTISWKAASLEIGRVV